MIIALGADHAGFELKQRLFDALSSSGHEVIDHGTNSAEAVDYPDFAVAVARDVVRGVADRGVLICGSGIGMAIAANKIPGVRAAKVDSLEEARLARLHNDANVLCFGARFIDPETAEAALDLWLATEFEGGRHARRVEKISELESDGGNQLNER